MMALLTWNPPSPTPRHPPEVLGYNCCTRDLCLGGVRGGGDVDWDVAGADTFGCEALTFSRTALSFSSVACTMAAGPGIGGGSILA